MEYSIEPAAPLAGVDGDAVEVVLGYGLCRDASVKESRAAKRILNLTATARVPASRAGRSNTL